MCQMAQVLTTIKLKLKHQFKLKKARLIMKLMRYTRPRDLLMNNRFSDIMDEFLTTLSKKVMVHLFRV